MLSMVDIREEQNEKTLRKMWQRLTTPSVQAYIRPVGTCHYLRIICKPRRGEINWKMVRAYSLDSSERVLLPIGTEPPANIELRRYIPYEYKRRLLENLACNILICSKKIPELRRVAIYGQESEVATFLPRLTKLAGEVRVITRRPYALADTVSELCSKTGAAITVTPELNAEEFDMLIAPSGGSAVMKLTGNTIVLAPDRPSAPTALWIKEARPSLPAVLEGEYDGRYDITEFTGAFYEAGNMREIGKMSPAAGVTECGEVSPEDAGAIICR